MSREIQTSDSGVRFQVRVAPHSPRDQIETWTVDVNGRAVLKLRVRALAEGGKANVAVIALLSQALNVPKKHVTIASGKSARIKLIEIAGDANRLTTQIQDLIQDLGDQV